MPRTPLPARALRTARALPPAARALVVVLLLGLVVTAGAPSSIRVHRGDTLSDIAQRYGTSVAALRALNGLAGNGIFAGQVLRVSGASRASSRVVERGYTVRSGDTLSGIAARYGVSVQTVRVRNRLSRGATLQVGRRLAIPVRVRRAGSSGSSGGVTIPRSVSVSAAHHRAVLRNVAVPSRSSVRRMVGQTARRYGVSPSLAVSVAYHESGFQQRVVSGVDAVGVMQVLPSTARVLSRQQGRNLNLLRAQDNITAGVLLLRQLLRATGSDAMALAGYYQGLGSISRQGLLPQTHAYIRNVAALRARFANG